jgi:PQ loop repeat
VLNIERKKTVGLNSDYVLWFLLSAVLDFASAITICFFYFYPARFDFVTTYSHEEANSLDMVIVSQADKIYATVFSLNAVISLAIIGYQVFVKDGFSRQLPSAAPPAVGFVVFLISLLFLSMFTNETMNIKMDIMSVWLTCIIYLSYLLEIIRFFPQIWINRENKAFVGIDLCSVFLDWIGAATLVIFIFSTAGRNTNATNRCYDGGHLMDCPKVFLDDPVRLLTGVLVFALDTALFIQYLMYRGNFIQIDLPPGALDEEEVAQPSRPSAPPPAYEMVVRSDDNVADLSDQAPSSPTPSAPPLSRFSPWSYALAATTGDTSTPRSGRASPAPSALAISGRRNSLRPVPSAPPLPGATWACFRCTLENDMENTACSACQLSRHESITLSQEMEQRSAGTSVNSWFRSAAR